MRRREVNGMCDKDRDVEGCESVNRSDCVQFEGVAMMIRRRAYVYMYLTLRR